MSPVFIYALYDSSDVTHFRYIGKTKNKLSRRLQQHIFNSAKDKTYKAYWIKDAIKKNNKIEIKLIEECDESNWQEREKYWISFYKEANYRLTNLTDGGDGHSMKGEEHPAYGKTGLNSWNYNKSRRYNPKPLTSNRKFASTGHYIKATSLENGEILKFPSIRSAARYFKGNYSVIRSNLIGIRKSAYGYTWDYQEDPQKEFNIIMLDDNKQPIKYFRNHTEVNEYFNTTNASISRALKTNTKAKNYYWAYGR